MNKFVQTYRKVELFFGNLKFAVIIISIFAIYLAFGTFMESYHGTDYANRLVYKSFPFMVVQFGMFLSILFATLIRLPPKKHLYGFYVIHIGLIVLFLGSAITYISGVDGSITLAPNSPSREIMINQDILKIQFPNRGKEVSVDLPYISSSKDLNLEYEGIKLKTFYPFAEDELKWVPIKIVNPGQSSSRYRIYNDKFGEFFTLTLHPLSDFNNTVQLGPLNIHYMPEGLISCINSENQDGLIVWNAELQNCMAPKKNEMKKVTGPSGKEVVEINFSGKVLRFLPKMSPFPVAQNMELDEKSPYRIFSLGLFEKSPHLFVFGKTASFFNKDSNRWESHAMEINSEVTLPWMGFKVRLLEFRNDAYPTLSPNYTKPINENGQAIKGGLKAVMIEAEGSNFWVKSNEPIAFNKSGERIIFRIDRKTLTLPYEITLDQFKMDTDPGTNNPASYESFVSLFRGNDGTSKHHIFMNNPLKLDNFTFYQASYFQTQEGPFGSVLSVNFDPGRAWKYFGSLLLVLGSIWHYFLRRKHITKPGVARA